MTSLIRPIGSRLVTLMGGTVAALVLGLCQLGAAGTPADRVHPVNHGSLRAGNRLSACRLEPLVRELGVSHGSPPGDSFVTPDAYSRRRSSPAPHAALASAALPLPSRRKPFSDLVTPTGVALATTALAALPARGPPEL